jgi:SAM-dependent methyltransferase
MSAQPDPVMAAAVRLGSSLEALAALAAYLRVETEDIPITPETRARLAAVFEEIVGTPGADLGPAAAPVVGLTRAFLRQAIDLVEEPGRDGGWAHMDPDLLQGIGRLSGAIADAFVASEPMLTGLGDALRNPGAQVLDVGTGTGWLAIALARTYPDLHVVGLDIFETPLALARGNVAAAGLEDRVELHLGDVLALDEDAVFDAIWLPLPFRPPDLVPGAVAGAVRALKPGGWLVPGTFAAPDDRLSQQLLELRTLRAGGHPWGKEEILDLLVEAELLEVVAVPRTWAAPVLLYGGRRA